MTIDDDDDENKEIQHNAKTIFLTRIKVYMCHNVIHLWPINTQI